MREQLLTPAKSAAATALTVLAHGLQLAAHTAQQSARVIQPSRGGDERAAARDMPQGQDDLAASEAVEALTRLDDMVASDEPAARTDDRRDQPTAAEAAAALDADRPARHVEPAARAEQEVATPERPRTANAQRPTVILADLAHRPAREVIAEVDRLSDDELDRLREHEQAGKQRKTVLQAIDKARRSR